MDQGPPRLSFAVERGGITTILGANGAGKTTTLRAVSGTVKTGGSVRFDGTSIERMATEEIVRLGIAHAPEGRGTFVQLTVEENLRLGAYARRDRTRLSEGARVRVWHYRQGPRRLLQEGERGRRHQRAEDQLHHLRRRL